MKFELLPTTVYTWRRQGSPLYIPTPGSNVRVAVCGAYRWPDGPFLFAHGPKSVNTALFVEMLAHVERRARRTGKLIILVIDNGTEHTSKRSQQEIERLKGTVQVYWLPSYSSEQLNDIEGVWGHLKQDYFSRMLVKSREEFTDAAVAFLGDLTRKGMLRRVLRPTGT